VFERTKIALLEGMVIVSMLSYLYVKIISIDSDVVRCLIANGKAQNITEAQDVGDMLIEFGIMK